MATGEVTILFANFEFCQALFLRDHDSSGIPGRLAARNVGLEKPPKKKDENAEHGDLINISWNWRFRSRSPYLRWIAHCLDGSPEPISRTQKSPRQAGILFCARLGNGDTGRIVEKILLT